jgi:FkbH-like protein
MTYSLDALLSTTTLAELRARLALHDVALGLPQVQRLRDHAARLAPPTQGLRVGIVHTYTSELLDPWLTLAAALQGMEVDTYHAPYGLSLQEAQADSALVCHKPDLTLLLLQREDLHPALAEPLAALDPLEQEALRQEVRETLSDIIQRFRRQRIGQLVITLLPTVFPPGLGLYDAQSERSEGVWWASLKTELGSLIRESVSAALFLDLDLLVQHLGQRHFFDLRLWYSARYPFTPLGAQVLAQRVINIGVGLKFPKAKVLVLDADNTLWGGILGEDGLNGIALGPEYPGNVYLEFQRRILHYQQRGFILALCSKNNAADVDQLLNEHPHQLIKDRHLAARRVNWKAKTDNLVSLAAELNVGLESFIFLDDSDYECAAVRHQLPQVEVVQTPTKPILIPFCLEHVARLEVLSITDEDRVKTQLYVQERHRKQFQETVSRRAGGGRDYLASLNMTMRVGFDDARHLKRLAQLTQKTNQFNLTTRRYDEQQIQHFIDAKDWLVAYFSLTDIFGDSGIVGLALWHRLNSTWAVLDNFLLSCRVLGRGAESAFLHAQLRYLTKQGITELVADYIPTAKNTLVENFLSQQGFCEGEDGRYRRNLWTHPAAPASAFPIAIAKI